MVSERAKRLSLIRRTFAPGAEIQLVDGVPDIVFRVQQFGGGRASGYRIVRMNLRQANGYAVVADGGGIPAAFVIDNP